MELAVLDVQLTPQEDQESSRTKLGGRPTIFGKALEIDPALLEKLSQQTICGVCGEPMFLLCQSYCPVDEQKEEHNRMLYVFCCNSSECCRCPSDSWRALSITCLGDEFVEDDENNEEPEDDVEVLDNGTLPTKAQLPPHTFPPFGLVVEPEPKKESTGEVDLAAQMRAIEEHNARMRAMHPDRPEVTEEDIKELEESGVNLKNKPEDIHFDKFRRRIERCPRQVLRYQRHGAPLFMNLPTRSEVTLKPCPSCGAALSMELQVMPGAIFFIRADQYVDFECKKRKSGDDGIDFGTVTVFTCSKACAATSLSVETPVVMRSEFVFVEAPPVLVPEEADPEDLGEDIVG